MFDVQLTSGQTAQCGLLAMEASRHALREEGVRLGGDGVVLDISEGKDFRLMKTVLREGDGVQPPFDPPHVST